MEYIFDSWFIDTKKIAKLLRWLLENYKIVDTLMISIDRCLLSFIMWSVWVVSCNTRWQLGLKQSQIPCFWHLSISQDRKIKQYLTLTSHFNVIENSGDLNSWNPLNGFNSLYSKQGHDWNKNYAWLHGCALIVMLNSIKYNQ